MKRIPLLLCAEQACSYLPGERSSLLFVDPVAGMNVKTYSALAQEGFRRSGNLVYRPHCAGCHACVPIRIPVADFRPNRNQVRVLARNADLTASARPPRFQEEHYQLFQSYLDIRHGDGGMAGTDRDGYLDFLASSWAATSFVEFRRNEALIGVAVVDRLGDGLSAVYTFFDPQVGSRSPGIYAVLWQIAEARRLNLEWLYLGFWVGACRKMSYKEQFRPLQALIDGTWRSFEKGEKIRV